MKTCAVDLSLPARHDLGSRRSSVGLDLRDCNGRRGSGTARAI